MSRTCYSLPGPTREEATRWLRRKLAMVRDSAPPPRPRPLRAWLAGALRIGVDELQPGLAVAVCLADGSLWLGDVRETTEDELVLALWGAEDMAVALCDVATIKVVPEHTWAERRAVVERQRRGEPADVIGIRESK